MRELCSIVTPGDLVYACWAYETMTGFAKSWQDFREAVGDHADLRTAEHRDELFAWLNSWGCRIAATGEARVKDCLAEWYEREGDRLVDRSTGLAEASDDDLRDVAGLFDSLIADMKCAASTTSLRFGPTAVSKTLFALRPRLLRPGTAPSEKRWLVARIPARRMSATPLDCGATFEGSLVVVPNSGSPGCRRCCARAGTRPWLSSWASTTG